MLIRNPKRNLISRCRPALLLCAVVFSGVSAGHAQQMQSGASSAETTDVLREQTSTEHHGPVLSSKRILAILREKPEIVVEVKKLMAEELQNEGYTVQDDAITDQMLYSGIATNKDLRASITDWMVSRGYVSEEEVRQLSEDTTDAETDGDISTNGMDDGNGQMLRRDSQTGDLPLDDSATTPASRTMGSRTELSKKDKTADDSEGESQGESQDSAARKESKTATKPAPSPEKPEVLRRPAPYNLQSLRDLYTQMPQPDAQLRRFGSNVFLTHSSASKQMPLDLPIGPDYVLGAGDGLTINLWGGLSQSFTRIVDREGKIVLPEAGSMVVAGLTLEHAEALIQHALAMQFHDAQVAVTIAHLRTVRVYVVGDVQRPGAYDISSLSTPLNALYAAGGPTAAGSLRIVRHLRGKTVLREVDLYDFLLHGVRAEVERLEDGDTILVPPAGPQVAVAGMVKRPAIYELHGSATLADLLDDAGGVQIAAALSHISVERIGEEGHRETVSFDLPAGGDAATVAKAMQAFAIQDGDRILVAPILPYSERAIYIEGHVARPGRYPWHDGLSLSEVIRSYQDLLPEPSDHGEIIRLDPPDLRPETIEFNVPELLAGNVQIHLQPFDTIRILGRYEADAPRVTIRGEVLRPGIYALSQQMTAAQLVRMAGGFKRSALLENADLATYEIQDGRQVISKRTTIQIGLAVNNGRADADVMLKPGDILTIHQVSGWNDIGASVKLNGEVTYPGTYGLQDGERLSSVLRRAGGFRGSAYPAGAVLLRLQVKDLEEKSREELIHQIETTSAAARLAPSASGGDQTGTLQLLVQQQDQVLQRLRAQPVSGRLVIRISGDIDSWANTPADIELRAGDVLTIPKRPGFVLVNGQVYNTSAITYVPGKSAGWYLRHAGGATDLANRKQIFIVRANGQVVGRHSNGWIHGDVLSQRLDPGDIVVVPQKIIGGSMLWRNLLSTAQVLSTVAVVVAVSGGL